MARDEEQEIRLLLERINSAWLKNPPDAIPAALEDCFHESMVIQGPGFQSMGEGGRDACALSYADFMRNAAVLDCTLSEPIIHLAGDAAIATYSWRMTYIMKGQQSTESGRDVFAFTRSEGRWLAFWRAMLPD